MHKSPLDLRIFPRTTLTEYSGDRRQVSVPTSVGKRNQNISESTMDPRVKVLILPRKSIPFRRMQSSR